MSDLPDGIYLRRKPRWANLGFDLIFVENGQYCDEYPVPPRPGSGLIEALDGWDLTRVADLPDLRMTEPQAWSSPVMARCASADKGEHLHLRRPFTNSGYPWECDFDYVRWSDLIDPRDLTADEIAEHNLWTGGEQR